MKILNFGSCNIDYVYSVQHMVTSGETLSAEQMDVFPGGKGLNQSIAVARSGAKVYHAGFVGQDGAFLKDILHESGADVTFLRKADCKNGHAIIQVDPKGHNSIIVYQGTNGMISKEFVAEVLAQFDKEDFILLQNEINDVAYLIDAAYQKQMNIVFNPSPFTKELQNIDLGKITYLILNEVEAKAFTGTDRPKDVVSFMREKYPRLHLVLTLGEQGCVYSDCTQVLSHPAYMVEAVDTTAAGDTFTGYFVSMIAAGKSPASAIKYASAASAVAVSRMGASPSIPTVNEVKEALQTLRAHINQNSKTEKLAEQIFTYLEDHLQDANLKELAERMGYSNAYIGTLVRQVTGDTFSRLLCRKRCEMAAALLSDTDLAIGDIIHSIGYENESFFRNAFRKLYGVTPLVYRKIKQEEGKSHD